MKSTSEHRKFNELMTLKELYEKIDPESSQEVPLVISRGQDSTDFTCTKFVYSYRAQKERKPGQEINKIEQRYIIARPLKATIFRLVFHTRNAKSFNANYAYRMTNELSIFDANPKISLTNKTTLNTQRNNSFDIQLIKGSGLLPYERQAEQLVQLLERNESARIMRIVLDFIQDI